MDKSPAQGGQVQAGDPASCQPPDVLFTLDRTLSMAVPPDGSFPDFNDPALRQNQTKWGIANQAVKDLTQILSSTIRPGLALFPRDPGPDSEGQPCIFLRRQMMNRKFNHDGGGGTVVPARNTQCEAGEILVPPAPEGAMTIANAIGTDSTRLCRSTPIAAAMQTAATGLANVAAAGRPQFVVLVTDGGDSCDPTEIPAAQSASTQQVQALAAAGIKTYVISFSGTAVNAERLNHLACAGRTVADLDTHCEKDAQGNYFARAGEAPLYLAAQDQNSLQTALRSIAGEVCCNCAGLI